MRKVSFCFALVLLAGFTCARGADTTRPDDGRMYGQWHSSRIGGGGWAQQVVSCPTNPNRLYVYVDMAGVYRSDDAGQHWRMMNAGLPGSYGGYEIRGIIVDPRDADRILIAVGHHDQPDHRFGLYASNDGGETYTRTLDALFVGNGVPHRDAGYTLVRHPRQPDVVLTGTFGEGLWRSTDNGKTWSNCGVRDAMITDIVFDAAGGNRVWLCAQPWTGKVAQAPRTLSGGFYQSSDSGVSWKKISDESPTEVVQDPSDPDHLLAIFENLDIRHSRDAGQTWTAYSDGLPVNPAEGAKTLSRSRFTVLAAGPDFFLAGNRLGDLFRLNRGQTQWQLIKPVQVSAPGWWGNPGDKPGWIHFGKAFGSIWIDPRNPARWMRTDWYAVWETTDAGAHWTLRADGYEPDVVFQISPATRNRQIVHLVMADNGYFRSDDAGRTFTKVDQGKITTQIRDLVLSPSSDDQLYAIGSSAESGGEWICNQLYVSKDAGIHWNASPMKGITDRKKLRCTSVAVDPADASRVYLAVSGDVAPNGGGVYRSDDGGQNFQWMGEGLPAGKPFFRTGFWTTGRELISTPTGLLAMSKSANALCAWNSKSGTWTQLTLPEAGKIFTISADPTTPGRIMVSLDGRGLFLSEKNGATGSWIKTYSGKTGMHAFDPNNPGVVAAMSMEKNSGLLLSRDGGRTWRMLDQRLPMRLGLNPAFVDGRVFVATHGAGVFEYMGD